MAKPIVQRPRADAVEIIRIWDAARGLETLMGDIEPATRVTLAEILKSAPRNARKLHASSWDEMPPAGREL